MIKILTEEFDVLQEDTDQTIITNSSITVIPTTQKGLLKEQIVIVLMGPSIKKICDEQF